MVDTDGAAAGGVSLAVVAADDGAERAGPCIGIAPPPRLSIASLVSRSMLTLPAIVVRGFKAGMCPRDTMAKLAQADIDGFRRAGFESAACVVVLR